MLATNRPLAPAGPDRVDLDAAALSYARDTAGTSEALRRARRDELIHLALPFASRLARRYRGRGEPLEDLEQAARLGLVKAVDRYDPERGSFTAYAAHTISGEVKRHFRDRTWGVHVPRRLQELSLDVSRATSHLTGTLARTPTLVELAQHLNVPETDVVEAIESSAGYSPTSLNAPRRDAATGEIGDGVGSPDADLDAVDDRITLNMLLNRLPFRERQILALRFYGNQTQSEIAAQFGISQVHVSRLQSRALTWLRAAMLGEGPQRWTAGGYDAEAELTVSTRWTGGVHVIDVAGEIDYDTAGRLRDALVASIANGQAPDVRIDLSRVPFVDAAGVAALLAAREVAGARVRLRIGPAQPHVSRTLTLAGLAEMLD